MSPMSHPFPCGICQKKVHNNQKYIKCTSCIFKVHIKCNGTTIEEYDTINESNSLLSGEHINENNWCCNKCLISNMAEKFPYGLESNYDLVNIMTTDSLKVFKNLPTYEIASKAYKIDSMNQYDIDDNIVNNINSRYYSAHEFNNMNDSESFKILHSNLNGLENKFDDYHTFVTSANSNFDVMCISETTQKENFPFNLNINIDGYGQPFTLGSKTARGGVAIYVKDEYNVIERNDLNIVDNSLEAVWVEIKNEKGKNIVCGCIYRHPNSDIDDFNNYISKCLTIINTEKKECYVSGDFNIDLLKYGTINKYAEFLNTLTSLGFLPHVLQPTRITEHSSTIIDNIWK